MTRLQYSLHSTWRNRQQILQTQRAEEHIWYPFVSVAYRFFGETRRTSNPSIDPQLIGLIGSLLFFLFEFYFGLLFEFDKDLAFSKSSFDSKIGRPVQLFPD